MEHLKVSLGVLVIGGLVRSVGLFKYGFYAFRFWLACARSASGLGLLPEFVSFRYLQATLLPEHLTNGARHCCASSALGMILASLGAQPR